MKEFFKRREFKNKISKQLHIQCNLYQNSNVIFYKNQKGNPRMQREAQKMPNSQNNPTQKGKCQKYIIPDCKLQYKHTNQKNNSGPGNKPTLVQPLDF